ncbi:MAG: FAD-linked oxidase C-terminal domain-containing protein, partial [Nakamurella sp.]
YRVLPTVVVEPLDSDDVLATLAVSRAAGIPVTSRGGGTSIAGNSIGPGIVIDFARHLNRILEVDADSRAALVQPGVILSHLQQQVAPLGLRFGPDPSSQNRATLGGMIGNNACGPHAVAYGRTADNTSALTLIDGQGRRISTTDGVQQIPGLDELVQSRLEVIRTEFGRFGRQVSGYSMEHLLPENGRDLAKAFVGSEGTLGVLLDATVRLVRISPARMLVVLGYPDMATAADAVPALLAHSPHAIEGLDSRLVDVVRRSKGGRAVPDLPRGAGWLMVEVGGETPAAAEASSAALIRDAAALDSMAFPAGPIATAMWQIRADGAGLAGRTPAGGEAWPGWEDAAVPPANLGRYLREFETLMAGYHVTGIPYGHFGDGCVHIRIDLPLEKSGDTFRAFIFDAARLVVKHGGSCSGEHGDGRARGELLPIMYSPAAIELFAGVKALFDPADLLNPGVLVRPVAIDADLRRPQAAPVLAGRGFSFRHDDGDFTKAVHRCVGIGKCRADNSASGGFMCPSYLASKDEKDVTRGRSRVLQELTNGAVIPTFDSAEVRESLDMCLSCKACASDCPAGVDMAQYKSEVLYRAYRGKIRPITHYSLGWLPRWMTAIHQLPRLAPAVINRTLANKALSRLLLGAAGIDHRRAAPQFAPTSFHRWWKNMPPHQPPTQQRDPVVLWVDSFTDGANPDVARAAVTVLGDAGYRVIVPAEVACCGLTWITTGQLGGARKRLLRLLGILGPYAAQGIPIVGLEPSCTAVLRSDLVDLLPDDPRSTVVAGATRTLAELLTNRAGTPGGWRLPDLTGVELIVQPHCHHHSVLGFALDEQLLASAGATVTVLSGCCGLAGNFGMEKGHYDMSVAVAENSLLPALRGRTGNSIVLADGFSCRTQIEQLAGLPSLTLAELLAAHRGPPAAKA